MNKATFMITIHIETCSTMYYNEIPLGLVNQYWLLLPRYLLAITRGSNVRESNAVSNYVNGRVITARLTLPVPSRGPAVQIWWWLKLKKEEHNKLLLLVMIIFHLEAGRNMVATWKPTTKGFSGNPNKIERHHWQIETVISQKPFALDLRIATTSLQCVFGKMIISVSY